MLLDAAFLFTVRVLNVVAPVMVLLVPPTNCTVLVLAVNVPLLIQFPESECVNREALNVVEALIVRLPFTVSPAAAVFVFPLVSVKW